MKWIWRFFPLQLLLIHFRQNALLIFFWLVLLGIVSGSLGHSYGLFYLFLFPEYLNEVSGWSYGILGFSFGGFIMSFQISSYIIHARRFPFLATLGRPFLKYCINNALIPLAFTLYYLLRTSHFLRENEGQDWIDIVWWLMAFLAGTSLFIGITLGYFFTFNKDLARLFGVDAESRKTRHSIRPVKIQLDPALREAKPVAVGTWRVDSYLRSPFKVALARPADHYQQEMLWQVFRQNHINGAAFEVIVFASLLVLGWFREIPVFQIPAGASFLLLFTMLLMLTSSVHFLLKRWSTLFFILVFVGLHFLSKNNALTMDSLAYGLNYSEPVRYHPDSIHAELMREKPFDKDLANQRGILDNWRGKIRKTYRVWRKPKAIFVQCSGGGMKAAYWSFLCLQAADSLTRGKFFDHTVLLTGSSGGMIGSSFYRELYLRYGQGLEDSLSNPKYLEWLGSDLLNPVATTIALNDLLLRLQYFESDGHKYPKDRGYAFEQSLSENLQGYMDKRLIDYAALEASGVIPQLIFSPTILNDGRRLIIGTQPLSFFSLPMREGADPYRPALDNVEFRRLFREQEADRLFFMSALRMNASFPYILPSVSLPSRPRMEISDAGLRDNFGGQTGLAYLFHLRQWFAKNTSGVILVRIHDSRSNAYDANFNPGLLDHIFSPVGGVVNNVTSVHLQEQEQMIMKAKAWYKGRLDVVDFRLADVLPGQISMSLHLTENEKHTMEEALAHPKVKESLSRLRNLIGN